VTLLERAGFETREAASATEALDALDGPPPALAVLDVHVPGGPSGYELRRALDERFGPKVPVLFIASERTQSLDGVDGSPIDGSDYLTTPFAPDELVARVRALVRTVLSVDLTPREREILVLFAEGLTQERIARALVISPKTVATHIDRVLGKLGVHSRAEAVAVAYRSGLVAATIDDKSVRTLVVTLLERAGFETHEAASAIQAVEALDDPPPALAVLDVHLPGGPSGYELRRALHERFGPDVSVLFIAGERTESLERVDGSPIDGGDYLTTPFPPDELVARVRALVHRSRRAVLSVGLTPREREILVLLAEGLTQERIARVLVISPRTVTTHIDRVLGKLGVHSRAEAVAVAYRSGLVAADS
jgi:two-component system, NarL family, nitrate/nitrite response regulator NarL